MSRNVVFLYAAWRPGEWLWVDSNGTDGKSTFHRRANQSDFPRFVIISQISRPEVRCRSRWYQKSALLEKNDPLWKILKIFPERIHHLSDPRIVCKFREIWLTGNRQSRALFTSQKKTKFRLALPLLLLCGSRPKSVRASYRQYTRSAPNLIWIRTLPAELQPDAWISLKRATKCFQYSAKLLRRVNIMSGSAIYAGRP